MPRNKILVVLTPIVMLILAWFVLPILSQSVPFCIPTAAAQDNPCLVVEATRSALEVQVFQLQLTGTALQATLDSYSAPTEIAILPIQAPTPSFLGDYAAIPQSRAADGGFVLGDPNAPITIVEFSDFTCPHCQTYEATISRFIEEYVATGQAQFEFRMFPIVHPTYAPLTAQLAECSDLLIPGAFWVARDAIFEFSAAGRYPDIITLLAERLGLQDKALQDCALRANQYTIDYRVGQEAGVQGTPATMVRYDNGDLEWITLNGETYNRGGAPFEVLVALVEDSQV
jgi:protein-disulfide isomerase